MAKKSVFIGQAVTGQDKNILNSEMEKIYDILSQKNLKPYSTLEEEGKNNFEKSGDWVKHAFKKIDNKDIYLGIVRNETKSEGFLMEVGYVISKNKRFVLAINENVTNTYIRDMTKEIIEWNNFKDFLIKLNKFNF